MVGGAVQRGAVLGAAVLTLVVLSVYVVHLSSAAFTAQTASATNSWATGSVQITNTMVGGAQFAATGLVPGQVVERCVLVSYTGTVEVDVRMYGGSLTHTNQLGDDLLVTVSSVAGDHRGTGATCAASYDAQTVQAYASTPRTLSSFATAHGSWGTGLSPAWVTSVGSSRTYRIRVRLSDTSTKTSSNASYVFRWEARTITPGA